MSDDLLKKLSEAASDDEREWIVTKDLLDSMSEDLRQVSYAAAIPHWFNDKILSALRPEITERIANLLEQLSQLPFVESFKDRGFNIHEKTRKLMLDYLWTESQPEFISLSIAAEKYFDNAIQSSVETVNNQIKKLEEEINDKELLQGKIQEWANENQELLQGFDLQYQIERIYHLIIAEPENGANRVRDDGWHWHDEFDYNYTALNALTHIVREHVKNNRVNVRAKNWGRFFEGLVASYHYEYIEAKKAFSEVVEANLSDAKLNADVQFRYGDVHSALSEMTEARARYEEALPIYRSIGAKMGEANCISSLGDVHKQLSEMTEARARYEEALPIYRSIGDKLGEANCIRSLGDIATKEKNYDLAIKLVESTMDIAKEIGPAQVASVLNNLANIYEDKKDYPKAVDAYTKAMQTFTGSHAYIIRNRANIYLKMEDVENAEKDITLAEQIQPINAFLFLRKGELANLRGSFEEAIKYFKKAIELIPRFSTAFFGIGISNLRMGKIQEANDSYLQGLSFTDSKDELDDTIEELEKLRSRQPEQKSIDTILELLRNWQPENK